MKFLQEYLDKEINFSKHKAKSTAPTKQSVVSQKQSDVYTNLQNIKIEFKELRERECTQMFILVHSKPKATSSLLINH